MADINTTIVKIKAALDEAQIAAGVPTDSAQIAALQTQVATLTSQLTAANATIATKSTEIALLKADETAVQAALDKLKTDTV